jgi:uncharacterized Zn finger protein
MAEKDPLAKITNAITRSVRDVAENIKGDKNTAILAFVGLVGTLAAAGILDPEDAEEIFKDLTSFVP